jgi:hypothetical protein
VALVRALSLLLLLSSGLAAAQSDLTPPPIVPLESPSYVQRCFAIPAQVWVPVPDGRYFSVNPAVNAAPLSNFHAAQPVGTPNTTPAPPAGSGSGGSGGSGSGGSLGSVGDGKALLVLAVVVVAVLPVIVYAVDEDAPAVVEQRFHCPTFGFDLVGGVDLGERVGTKGGGSGRITFGMGYFGTDFQFDTSAGSINSWSSHLLLRIAPKSHIEPNLALGFRSMTLGGTTRLGLEFGVPHRYVFWREGLRQFSLELRPTVTVGPSGFDVGVESALIIPIVEPIHLRAGGKVQSFGNDIIGGFNAGLTFSL